MCGKSSFASGFFDPKQYILHIHKEYRPKCRVIIQSIWLLSKKHQLSKNKENPKEIYKTSEHNFVHFHWRPFSPWTAIATLFPLIFCTKKRSWKTLLIIKSHEMWTACSQLLDLDVDAQTHTHRHRYYSCSLMESIV